MGRFLQILLLILVVLGVGFYFYQKNIPAATVTAGDLEKGGNFSDGERTTLVAACKVRMKKDGDKACGCIADKVASQFSRFDRMLITATFQEKLSDMVALTKGLIASGIPAETVKAAEDGSKTRIKEMLKTCNAE
jgi:hypothetical protein